jgi:hypothetical protein
MKFSQLVGKTFIRIEQEQSLIRFHCSEKEIYCMYHEQDCCEQVHIDDIVGDLEDLIGTPILYASEDSNHDNPKITGGDSFTWTFYNIATIKGHVTIKWYGSSNGYYSESVTIELDNDNE